MKKNFEEFKFLIENLEKTPFVICLTETWLTQKDNPEVFNLPGYHPITGKHRDGKEEEALQFTLLNRCNTRRFELSLNLNHSRWK